MRKSHLIGLCLSGIVAFVTTDVSRGEDTQALSMDVQVHQLRHGEMDLNIALKNISKGSLWVNRYDLPWEFRYSLQVVIVRGFPGREGVLEEKLPVADPSGAEQVELKPGQTLTGSVSLNKRFPTLAAEIKARSLYIFWMYEVTPKGNSSVQRFAGWSFVARDETHTLLQQNKGVGSLS